MKKKVKTKNGKNRKIGNIEPVAFDEKYKSVEFEIFRTWMSLPHIFRKKDARILDALAIPEDDDIRDLLSITTQKEFGEKYGINKNTMSVWKAEIKSKGHLYEDTKEWVKSVMNNVVGAVYKQLLIDGDSQRAKFLATFAGQYTEKKEEINPKQDAVNDQLVKFLDRFKPNK